MKAQFSFFLLPRWRRDANGPQKRLEEEQKSRSEWVRTTSVDLPAACPPLKTPVYYKSFRVELMKKKRDDVNRSE